MTTDRISRNTPDRMDLPFVGLTTFARQPACPDWDKLDGADVAILGVPIDTASSYRVGTRFGPRAIREVSMFHGFGPEGVFDFEDEVTYLTAEEVKIVDAGDSDVIYADTKRSLANAEQAVRAMLDARTMPYILGGDHAITMATIAAFSNEKPVHIVHLDAHFDFIDERNGISWGHGSPMRRASEMAHVKGITTLGPHNMASVSRKDWEAAKAYGTHVVPLRKLRAQGAAASLAHLPDGERVYVSIDIDSFDPSIAPGTATISHGGFTYYEGRDILKEVATALRGGRRGLRRGVPAVRSVRRHRVARRPSQPRFHRRDLPRTRETARLTPLISPVRDHEIGGGDLHPGCDRPGDCRFTCSTSHLPP